MSETPASEIKVTSLSTLTFGSGKTPDLTPMRIHLIRDTDRGYVGGSLCGLDPPRAGGPSRNLAKPSLSGAEPCQACIDYAKRHHPDLFIRGVQHTVERFTAAIGTRAG